MSARVREEALPSAAAGLLQLARLQAGISQQELAGRAGVDRSMISAYEHDRRQPTLPTLLKLLKAAGFDLRMHLEAYDDHDDVLEARERSRPRAEREAWKVRQTARLEALESPRTSRRTQPRSR
jgi:transcriptional regulator with XRE-family HTH domain